MHDLSINLLVLVYWKRNADQSNVWKEPYNLLSIKGKSIMIELLYDLTKFKNTSLKSYFINNQKPIPDSLTSIQISVAKVAPAKTAPAETPQTKTPLADSSPIKQAAK